VDRASVDAGRIGALDAARGLNLGRGEVEAEEGLVPVMDADLGILLRDLLTDDL
jgi:hypothetical protein